MKCLFKVADDYLKQSDWKDLALIKLCLCSVGLLLGLSIPKRSRKPVGVLALIVFVGTYVPLMVKVFGVMKCSNIEQEIEID